MQLEKEVFVPSVCQVLPNSAPAPVMAVSICAQHESRQDRYCAEAMVWRGSLCDSRLDSTDLDQDLNGEILVG